MTELVSVSKDNTHLLQEFINNIGSAAATFRYFSKRDVGIIQQHLTTLLFLQNSEPIAYGHLEKEGPDVWLGICIRPGYNGQGYGKLMMKELIKSAKLKHIPALSLTVDKDNIPAIELYEKLGFSRAAETDNYFKYVLRLQDTSF